MKDSQDIAGVDYPTLVSEFGGSRATRRLDPDNPMDALIMRSIESVDEDGTKVVTLRSILAQAAKEAEEKS